MTSNAPTPPTRADVTADAEAPAPGGAATPQMRLQVLSTEHWSLLASRNLAWTESFSRTGIFLSTLSFAVVALALVAQASAFGEAFRLFALVVLPVVLFLGIGTLLRLDTANYHDALCVIGMNRIRAAYMRLAPDLETHFVMGTTDDEEGVRTTMALPPRPSFVLLVIAATPFQVAVINAVLLATIFAVLAVQLGTSTVVALIVGAAGLFIGTAAFMWYTSRRLGQMTRDYRPLFPRTPDATGEAGEAGEA